MHIHVETTPAEPQNRKDLDFCGRGVHGKGCKRTEVRILMTNKGWNASSGNSTRLLHGAWACLETQSGILPRPSSLALFLRPGWKRRSHAEQPRYPSNVAQSLLSLRDLEISGPRDRWEKSPRTSRRYNTPGRHQRVQQRTMNAWGECGQNRPR